MNAMVKYEAGLLVDGGLNWGLVAGQVKTSTIRVYKLAWDKYVAYCGGISRALDSAMLASYRQYMVNETKYSPATINRELSSIKSIVKLAGESKLIDSSVVDSLLAVRGVKVAALLHRVKSEKLVYSREDIKKLIDAPFNVNKNVTPTILMHRALLLTLATTGMRANEVSNLKLNQIVKVNDSYTVTNILGKTDVTGRSCKISSGAVEAINVWIAERGYSSEYVFTSRKGDKREQDNISETAIYQIVTKYADMIGLKDFHPHSFRAYVATTLAEVDVKNAQMQLGHKSAATTLNRYVVKKLQDNLVEDLV